MSMDLFLEGKFPFSKFPLCSQSTGGIISRTGKSSTDRFHDPHRLRTDTRRYLEVGTQALGPDAIRPRPGRRGRRALHRRSGSRQAHRATGAGAARDRRPGRSRAAFRTAWLGVFNRGRSPWRMSLEERATSPIIFNMTDCYLYYGHQRRHSRTTR